MQEQISFKFRAFQLPLPCRQPGGNGHWCRQRGRHKIIVCSLYHCWIPSPDPEQIKRHTDDEQGDRKMNDYRVLRVFCKQGRFEVKRMHMVFGEASSNGCLLSPPTVSCVLKWAASSFPKDPSRGSSVDLP